MAGVRRVEGWREAVAGVRMDGRVEGWREAGAGGRRWREEGRFRRIEFPELYTISAPIVISAPVDQCRSGVEPPTGTIHPRESRGTTDRK